MMLAKNVIQTIIATAMAFTQFAPSEAFGQQDTAYFYAAGRELDPNKQIELYTKALEFCADSSGELRQSYIYRGISKMMVGQYQGAISDFEVAIPIQVVTSKVYWIAHKDYFRKVENGMAYLSLGDCFRVQDKMSKACTSYYQAIDYDFDSANQRIQKYCR